MFQLTIPTVLLLTVIVFIITLLWSNGMDKKDIEEVYDPLF